MLTANNLTKIYPNNKGITKISINIDSSEILALIGPNGSGKSTTLKIIAGVMKSQEGNVLVNNLSTTSRESKRYIGYLPEDLFFYEKMSVYEFLDFVACVKFKSNLSSDIESLLASYDLWEHRHQLLKNLSMGMKKKIGIISAFLGNPNLIILDEPTNGIDTKGIITLKKQINDSKSKGAIIIISSHILDFVSSICSRFIFLKHGQIAKDISSASNLNLEALYSELYL
ncbi:ABC transporter ATP-binding protein [Clostridium sp. JS66]|uniref:ABC transporter ATP-binding protein n=1 Tax=Clostridium sp. JS66 TaxID=3064705 RepID=UPI00298E1CCF|nr:ABC transporter ATP-binding protein [Clostridium sp. JS66]WPC42606.1 ABC transporter ATP-binding protein [Clostridium sp. JS66]